MSQSPPDSPATGTRAHNLGKSQTIDQSSADLLSSRLTPLLDRESASTAGEAPPAPGSRRSGGEDVEAGYSSAGKTWPDRLDLTRGATRNMRRHLARGGVRVTVLLTGDALALLGLRWLLLGARDLGWFGS